MRKKKNTILSVQMCAPTPLWTEDTSSAPTGELWLASLDEVWPLPPPHCQISQPRHLQIKTNPQVMFMNTKLFFWLPIIISRCILFCYFNEDCKKCRNLLCCPSSHALLLPSLSLLPLALHHCCHLLPCHHPPRAPRCSAAPPLPDPHLERAPRVKARLSVQSGSSNMDQQHTHIHLSEKLNLSCFLSFVQKWLCLYLLDF